MIESPASCAAGRPPSNGVLQTVNPLTTPTWDSQLACFPDAIAFHTAGWSRVLHETYGHTPCFLGRYADDRMVACQPLAEVRSPMTGRRGVCLPFSDWCPPLMQSPDVASDLWDAVLALARQRGWKYVELRSPGVVPPATRPSVEYIAHVLDLRPDQAALEAGLDPSVRRALRKAVASGLQVEISHDPAAVADYYRLHCLTRQRHGLPPQPFRFFDNIARHMLAADQGIVVTALHQGRAVAAAVFLHFGRRALYKFGASDAAAQALRPNNLVMWEGIRYYKQREFESLHFGRTSPANDGLRRFKRHFGAAEQPLPYYRYHLASEQFVPAPDRAETALNGLFRRLPLAWLRLVGRCLYPHLS
mgnify:CR=1 FL=1